MQENNNTRAPAAAPRKKARDGSLDSALLDIKCGDDDWLETYAPITRGKNGKGPFPID